MENNGNMANIVIQTINEIFKNMFSSIDKNLYDVLDDLTFISSEILKDKYFNNIFGTSATNGILLVSNSLLIGFVLYFAVRHLMSNFTYTKIENPFQFIFKLIIFAICMNSSYFIIQEVLDINSLISSIIRSIGEDLFKQDICFSNLLNNINKNLKIDDSLNVFSVDGLIKSVISVSFLNLVTVYALRYVTVKIFVLLAPFAILSLVLESTSWFFKLWFRNLFSLLFIQVIVSIVLMILFSIDYSDNNLLTKFIYIGGIYSLIKANSFMKEFMIGSGISSNVPNNLGIIKK